MPASTEPDVDRGRRRARRAVDGAGGPGMRICVDADAPPGWLSFWDLVFGAPGERPAAVARERTRRRRRAPVQLGHDGAPKAVRHTHRSLVGAGNQLELGVGCATTTRCSSSCRCSTSTGSRSRAPPGSRATTTLLPRFDLDTMLAHRADGGTLAFGATPIAVAMANHPELEQLRPLVPSLHDVGRHPDRTGRRQSGDRTHGASAGSTPTRHRVAGPAHQPGRLSRPLPLDTPGLPVSDLEVRIVDLETYEDVPRAPKARSWFAVRTRWRGICRRRRTPTRSSTAGCAPVTWDGSSPRVGSTSPTGPRR